MQPHTLRQRLTHQVTVALQALVAKGTLPETDPAPRVLLSPPKQPEHGDYSCAVALSLAKSSGKKPRDVAIALQQALGLADGLLAKTDVAGPGYLNLTVAPHVWSDVLRQILKQGGSFLRSNTGQGERILLEYVSANPTGPLHVAHGRGAVMGDVLARLLSATGYAVEREYYVNDLGRQTDVMAESLYLRYAEACGRPFTPPDDFYPGSYITEMATELLAEVGKKYLDSPPSDYLEPLRSFGIAAMRRRIEADLQAYGIAFDHFVSERALTAEVDLMGMVQRLERAGHIYEKEGKKWFRTTDFGDDKDRVVLREDGRPTYFASDIAYHDHKMQRGFPRLINVWGADHAGYVTRVKAGLQALGHDPAALHVVFIQMVSLSRGGAAVKMGKRLGTAVWLREIIDEVGRDAARYFFLMRRCDAQMDFDLDLATRKTLDNPVFYAQMGHARLASIARKALEAGIAPPQLQTADLSLLQLPEEIELIRTLARAPDLLADAAQALEPHQVVVFIAGLIAQFHSYYTQYKNTDRVVGDDGPKTHARLLLCRGLQTVLKELLDLLGVHAPERMVLTDPA